MALIGVLNVLLASRCLPAPQQKATSARNGFDSLGTLLLGLTLGAYALAVTVGHGHFDRFNVVLLAASVLGLGLFVLAETRVASPLIHLAAFRDYGLSASLAMNVLVATVICTTLVVPPFYLSHTLGLNAALVGLVMSTGTVVSVMSGIPAGRIVDRFGTTSIVIFGLIQMAAGALALSMLPMMFGVAGYVAAVALMAPGYQLFQAANNTAVMKDVSPDQRGVISGMLNLSRNLGLITGASVMGALFAFAAGATDITTAEPQAIANGMRITFLVDAGLMVAALAIAIGSRAFAKPIPEDNL
jgi:sugar phosphate permease